MRLIEHICFIFLDEGNFIVFSISNDFFHAIAIVQNVVFIVTSRSAETVKLNQIHV